MRVSSRAIDAAIAKTAHSQNGNIEALFVRERVIVELDSWPFHKDKIAFESDRERDAVMLAHDHVTVRVTSERIDQQAGSEAERLHTILARRRAAQARGAA